MSNSVNPVQRFKYNKGDKKKILIWSIVGAFAGAFTLSVLTIIFVTSIAYVSVNQHYDSGYVYVLFVIPLFLLCVFCGMFVWQLFNKWSDSFKKDLAEPGELALAPVHKRVWAYLIDYTIEVTAFMFVAFILPFVLYDFTEVPQEDFMLIVNLFALFGYVPFILVGLVHMFCEMKWGQSIGKRLMGVKVVAENGQKAKASKIFVRTLLRIADFFTYFAPSYLLMQTGVLNQTLGDRVAKTVVVDCSQKPVARFTSNVDDLIQ